MSTEAYKTITDNLPSFEAREHIRTTNREFKDFIKFWNKGVWNSAKRVGFLMNATRKLSEDATRTDWVRTYFSTCKTPEQVVEQVTELSTASGLPFSTALTWWWIHIIDSAYVGWHSENECFKYVKAYAETKGYKARMSTPSEDKDEGVDIVVFDPQTDRIIVGVQVKVKSYFYSNRETVVQAREVYNPSKYQKFTKRTGAEVSYLVIEDTLTSGELAWRKPHLYNQQ